MAYRKTEHVIAQLAARREAIVDAATELVERGGREALTSARLADAAKVSEGGLYKHFPDMGEVWAAVVARALRGDLAAMEAASEEVAGSWARLHASLVALYKRFTRRQLRDALFADVDYREGLRRALEPLLLACKTDSRVYAAAVIGTLCGVYQMCGQARSSAEIAADYATSGLGMPSRVMAAVAAARQS